MERMSSESQRIMVKMVELEYVQFVIKGTLQETRKSVAGR